jgi:predicted RNase H-like HicB family nuclease
MTEYHYTIVLHPEPEEGGYSVTVPALPGCYAQGESVEEAIALAKEAIKVHIHGLIEDGQPIPKEEEPTQVIRVRVAA